jgi:hypothetical protein
MKMYTRPYTEVYIEPQQATTSSSFSAQRFISVRAMLGNVSSFSFLFPALSQVLFFSCLEYVLSFEVMIGSILAPIFFSYRHPQPLSPTSSVATSSTYFHRHGYSRCLPTRSSWQDLVQGWQLPHGDGSYQILSLTSVISLYLMETVLATQFKPRAPSMQPCKRPTPEISS